MGENIHPKEIGMTLLESKEGQTVGWTDEQTDLQTDKQADIDLQNVTIHTIREGLGGFG